MTCDWCRNVLAPEALTSFSVKGVEVYGHLCLGCAHCATHGAPPIDFEDKPFTALNKGLQRFTEEFFSPIPQHARKCV